MTEGATPPEKWDPVKEASKAPAAAVTQTSDTRADASSPKPARSAARPEKALEKLRAKVPQAAVLDSPKRVERFLREAKAAAALRHPNIVPVYDAGVTGGQHFIASAEGELLVGRVHFEQPVVVSVER